MSGPGGPDRSLATSFGSAAEAYERGRPAYPADLLDALHHELDLGPGRDLLDLAAGTGKLTRQLVPFGAHLVAVEPLAEMRARFEHAVPGVLAIDGTAEDIPLAADSIDIVLVAQAYHWFDRDRANREVARVLRPGGHLVCLWNFEDVDVAWVAAVEAVKDGASDGRRALIGAAAWDFELGAPAWFDARRSTTTRHSILQTADEFLASFASRSYVIVLAAARQRAAIDHVGRVIAAFDEPFAVPYRTEAVWWRRTSEPVDE